MRYKMIFVMLNEQLNDLYRNNLGNLMEMYSVLDGQKIFHYVGPLLIYCWEERYLSSKYRLMIIGQETNGWYDSYVINSETLWEDIAKYKSFRLGEFKQNSPFWRYAHEFNKRVNGVDDLNFIWCNINKFGVDGRGRASPLVTNSENCYFNLLSEELAILRPEVCLFLTGPNYDDDIRHKLCDVQFEEFKDFDIRKVAKLKSSFLPSKSYRTYHPGYGNRKKSIYVLILSAIIDDIGK